jgi:hypothetical protein
VGDDLEVRRSIYVKGVAATNPAIAGYATFFALTDGTTNRMWVMDDTGAQTQLSSHDEDGNYSVMICHKCHKDIKETSQRILSHSFTEFRFRNSDTTNKLRQQSLERAIINKERRALYVIKPNMIHWAFKYQGPCYNLIKRCYT